MNKTLLIATSEYLRRVRSVWFAVATLAVPLLSLAVFALPMLAFSDDGDVDRIAVAGGKRADRQRAAAVDAQRAHQRLDLGKAGDGHRQFADPQSDEQRHRFRHRRHAAAHPCPRIMRRTAAHRCVDQGKHRRVQRVEPGCDRRIGAVARQRILGQVVATDRKERSALGKRGGGERCGRGFDHDA